MAGPRRAAYAEEGSGEEFAEFGGLGSLVGDLRVAAGGTLRNASAAPGRSLSEAADHAEEDIGVRLPAGVLAELGGRMAAWSRGLGGQSLAESTAAVRRRDPRHVLGFGAHRWRKNCVRSSSNGAGSGLSSLARTLHLPRLRVLAALHDQAQEHEVFSLERLIGETAGVELDRHTVLAETDR